MSANLLPTHTVNRLAGVEDNIWITLKLRKLPSVIIGYLYSHPKTSYESFEYIQDILRSTCLREREREKKIPLVTTNSITYMIQLPTPQTLSFPLK